MPGLTGDNYFAGIRLRQGLRRDKLTGDNYF
jgi:hypothetical protein